MSHRAKLVMAPMWLQNVHSIGSAWASVGQALRATPLIEPPVALPAERTRKISDLPARLAALKIGERVIYAENSENARSRAHSWAKKHGVQLVTRKKTNGLHIIRVR